MSTWPELPRKMRSSGPKPRSSLQPFADGVDPLLGIVGLQSKAEQITAAPPMTRRSTSSTLRRGGSMTLTPSLAQIADRDLVIEVQGFPLPPPFKVGGKEGNVITKSNLNTVHRGWRIVAIAGQRVTPKDVASTLMTAQQRPRFTVTFRMGDKAPDEDDDCDEQAILLDKARREAEAKDREAAAERCRLEAEEADRRRREGEEAERKRRQAEEALRKQREANEEAEKKRRDLEAAESLRQETEAAERKRRDAEESERKRHEAEEAERKRREAEELEQKRKEAEEADRRRKEAEEAERIRRKTEEAELKQRELAEEAERHRQKEESERLRKEAEEIERQRKEIEEAEREKEEADRKRKELEEAERLKAEETERLRIEAENAERQRKEQEAAERRREAREHEARLQAEAEAERLRLEAAEAERKRKEAEERKRREAEDKKRKEAEELRRQQEMQEAERKRKEADAAARKQKEAEELARKRREAEEAEVQRKLAEEEARNQQKLAVDRKTAEKTLQKSTGLPPKDKVAEPQKALMAALCKPKQAAAPPRKPQGPCDKCDGPHDTDECPHFKKTRDKHKDAWARYGAENSGSEGAGKHVISKGKVVSQPGDGSCLFHSLAYGLRSTNADRLRAEIADYIMANPEAEVADNPIRDWVLWDSGMDPTTYAKSMRAGSRWGGAVELAVCAKVRQVRVDVYERASRGFERISSFECDGGSGTGTVNLLYGGRVHYDALQV